MTAEMDQAARDIRRVVREVCDTHPVLVREALTGNIVAGTSLVVLLYSEVVAQVGNTASDVSVACELRDYLRLSAVDRLAEVARG